jgi:hypothetical protein
MNVAIHGGGQLTCSIHVVSHRGRKPLVSTDFQHSGEMRAWKGIHRLATVSISHGDRKVNMMTSENENQESPGLMSRVTKTTEQVKSGISDQTTRVNDAYGQVRGSLMPRDYQKITQMFREWLPTLAGEGLAKKLRTEVAATISWLTDLPEEELESFVRRLYANCYSFNFYVEWLVDPETNKIIDEPLRKTMGEIVLLYCLATWRADQIQEGMKIFVSLQKWLENPFAGQYEEFNHQLFARLVVEKLTPEPPVELFLAAEEERATYAVQAIQDLIAENNERFYQILRSQIDVTAAQSAAQTDTVGAPSQAESDETS